MALPKIDAPTFNLTLPASKKEIKFRPFLVKEQKNLLMAMESGEPEMIEENVKQVLTNCSITEFDLNTLPLVDIEYYFLHLRAKSIGEEINLKYKCNNVVEEKVCGGTIETTFNINDIKVDFPEEAKDVVMITDKIGIKLKYPDYRVVSNLKESYSLTDMTFELVFNCIDYIFDSDNFYYAHESTKEELMTFLESLTAEQFEKIENFVENVPKIKKNIEMVCSKCGYQHKIELETLEDFFV